MNYWLLKSEPESYAWSQLKKDVITTWDGIRNHQAKNYMFTMSIGDLCFFYHSRNNPMIVGIAEVLSLAYLDQSDHSGKFLAIDIKYYKEIMKPVSLKEIKAHPALSEMQILKQTRLSISPLTQSEWDTIILISES